MGTLEEGKEKKRLASSGLVAQMLEGKETCSSFFDLRKLQF